MAIERDRAARTVDAWLKFDPLWLARLFGVNPTGHVRVVAGMIHVGVRVQVGDGPDEPREGQVLEGRCGTAVVPMGLIPESSSRPRPGG